MEPTLPLMETGSVTSNMAKSLGMLGVLCRRHASCQCALRLQRNTSDRQHVHVSILADGGAQLRARRGQSPIIGGEEQPFGGSCSSGGPRTDTPALGPVGLPSYSGVEPAGDIRRGDVPAWVNLAGCFLFRLWLSLFSILHLKVRLCDHDHWPSR